MDSPSVAAFREDFRRLNVKCSAHYSFKRPFVGHDSWIRFSSGEAYVAKTSTTTGSGRSRDIPGNKVETSIYSRNRAVCRNILLVDKGLLPQSIGCST